MNAATAKLSDSAVTAFADTHAATVNRAFAEYTGGTADGRLMHHIAGALAQACADYTNSVLVELLRDISGTLDVHDPMKARILDALVSFASGDSRESALIDSLRKAVELMPLGTKKRAEWMAEASGLLPPPLPQ